MKKLFLIALAAIGMLTAQAQKAVEAPTFGSNWSIGIDGGGTTTMAPGADFFDNMRGVAGLHIQKQISPIFALGVEGVAMFNTTGASTVVDQTYVGAYGAINLFNLFGGFKCDGRFFDMEIVAGAGWGHDYYTHTEGADWNYFATKAGVNFNFNVTKNWTISLKPYFSWDMSDAKVAQTTAAYDRDNCRFNVLAGVAYKFGDGFKCVDTKNQAEIDALNARINALRGELDACVAGLAATTAQQAAVQAELDACKNRKPEVIKEVSNNLQSVRYVFYKIGSSKITADQQPNVEMVADYLKNHKDSKVVVKGYASPDGNLEFNKKLAAARAESVKTMLVKKYGIKADRITAQGEGIGDMFTENSWNRVSICTLED
ncbi:MAG: OmpA family protein [Paramuribaculum sp.]|nr:OmpA family protein [Paramuribaculum sp.]